MLSPNAVSSTGLSCSAPSVWEILGKDVLNVSDYEIKIVSVERELNDETFTKDPGEGQSPVQSAAANDVLMQHVVSMIADLIVRK